MAQLRKNHNSIVDTLLALEEQSINDHTGEDVVFNVTERYKVVVNSIERALSNTRSDLIGDDCFLYICAEIYHAGSRLSQRFTTAVAACTDPQWNETLLFEDMLYKNIPLGTRILFTLYHRK